MEITFGELAFCSVPRFARNDIAVRTKEGGRGGLPMQTASTTLHSKKWMSFRMNPPKGGGMRNLLYSIKNLSVYYSLTTISFIFSIFAPDDQTYFDNSASCLFFRINCPDTG